MKEYLESASDVLESLGTAADGLSSADAQSRLEKHGKNKLDEKKKKSLVSAFLEKLADPMLIILMIAAVLSVLTSSLSGETEWSDAIIILVVVLINAVLGVVQESKAEKAIEALQQMSKAKTKVRRDGKIIQIESENLVPGDIVLLEAGDSVPADGRLLKTASLKAEEAALTGESVPSDKHEEKLEGNEVPLGDRKNMVYMGSTIVYGHGEAVITATGMTWASTWWPICAVKNKITVPFRSNSTMKVTPSRKAMSIRSCLHPASPSIWTARRFTISSA